MRRVGLCLFVFFLLNSAFHTELSGAALVCGVLGGLGSLLPVTVRTKARTVFVTVFCGDGLQAARRRIACAESITRGGFCLMLGGAAAGGAVSLFPDYRQAILSLSLLISCSAYAVITCGFF